MASMETSLKAAQDETAKAKGEPRFGKSRRTLRARSDDDGA